MHASIATLSRFIDVSNLVSVFWHPAETDFTTSGRLQGTVWGLASMFEGLRECKCSLCFRGSQGKNPGTVMGDDVRMLIFRVTVKGFRVARLELQLLWTPQDSEKNVNNWSRSDACTARGGWKGNPNELTTVCRQSNSPIGVLR